MRLPLFETQFGVEDPPQTDRKIGGENIYPLEIEEWLAAHPAIAMAVVVGLKSKRYGEVAGVFLKGGEGQQQPGDDEVRDWVRRRLGKHKAPEHIFWLGRGGVPADVPLTGSGKVKKFQMAELGTRLLAGAGAAEEGVTSSKL